MRRLISEEDLTVYEQATASVQGGVTVKVVARAGEKYTYEGIESKGVRDNQTGRIMKVSTGRKMTRTQEVPEGKLAIEIINPNGEDLSEFWEKHRQISGDPEEEASSGISLK